MRNSIKNCLLFVTGFLLCYLLFSAHSVKAKNATVWVTRAQVGTPTQMSGEQVVGFSCVQHEGNADCYIATQ